MIGNDVVGGVPSIKFIRVSFTISEIKTFFFTLLDLLFKIIQ